MIAWLKALPLLWRLAAAGGLLLALAGAVGGLYGYVRHQGYVSGYADASAACEAEKARQQEANRQAIEDAQKEIAGLAYKLSLQDKELDDAIAAVDAAAAADPHALDQCLDADSVRALSAIR